MTILITSEVLNFAAVVYSLAIFILLCSLACLLHARLHLLFAPRMLPPNIIEIQVSSNRAATNNLNYLQHHGTLLQRQCRGRAMTGQQECESAQGYIKKTELHLRILALQLECPKHIPAFAAIAAIGTTH